MKKDPTLINIYLKIHNKETLFLDDLRYLAKYAPECFEKTCKNVIYNMPETKPIMDPQTQSVPLPNSENTVQKPSFTAQKTHPPAFQPPAISYKAEGFRSSVPNAQNNIDTILDNIKRLEADDFPVSNVDAEEVKNLLGNLYMELLFPHNDIDTTFHMDYWEQKSTFDKKA